MDDYISKPVQINELIKVLSNCQPLGSRNNSIAAGSKITGSHITSTGSSTATPIDFAVLEELKTMMGNGGDQLVNELVAIFLEDTPKLLGEVKQGVIQGDAEQLWRAAHTLKSSSANLGALGLSTLCKDLETMGRAGILEGAAEKAAAIEKEYNQVKGALEAEYSTAS